MSVYKYNAFVDRVVDGDTIEVSIDLGFHLTIKETLRLVDIDAFETRGDERDKGLEASLFLQRMIERREVLIETFKEGSFGRWLAKVWYNDGNYSVYVNQALVDEGHAKPYQK